MMCSNLMKCGVVCAQKTRRGGCGQRCAVGPAKSSPSSLEIEGKRPVFSEGKPSRMNTNIAPPSVIFGRPIKTFFRQKPIAVLGRKLGRPRVWNDGTTSYANGLGATCDKRCPFPNRMRIMLWFPSSLLFSILWAYHLLSNHYPNL